MLLEPLLQRRIIGIHLFELGREDLHVLQLPAFLPVIDQQHPCLAIVRMALNDFLQLFLRRFELMFTVQRGGQVVAVIPVVWLKFNGLGQAEQGEFALLVMQQPQPQSVLQAENGEQAFEILASKPHLDMMITDFRLPGGISGVQIAEPAVKLRPELKVIFISGYAQEIRETDSPITRQAPILDKPFDLDKLQELMQDMLS